MSINGLPATLLASGLLFVALPVIASERSDDDFIKACTSSSNLSQAVCACSASKARSELTADGFALLVATLERNDEVATKLRSKLPVEQVMKAGTFMLRGPSQCAKESAAAS